MSLSSFILTEWRLDYSFGKALSTSGLHWFVGHTCPGVPAERLVVVIGTHPSGGSWTPQQTENENARNLLCLTCSFVSCTSCKLVVLEAWSDLALIFFPQEYFFGGVDYYQKARNSWLSIFVMTVTINSLRVAKWWYSNSISFFFMTHL